MKIGIIGCAGRMGKTLVQTVAGHASCKLAGGTEYAASPAIGQDVAQVAGLEPCGIKILASAEELIKNADAVIDFTTPENTLNTAALVAKHGKILVAGTTGFDTAQQAELKNHANKTPIVWSSNMSIGVNLLFAMVEQMVGILGPDYDIEILEMHHRHKKDSPSGTALSLGEAAAKGRKVHLKDVARYSRDGIIGERPIGEIGFATLRGGSVIGDHTVIFASDDDRIEITHKSSSRGIYARGAVQAALWAQNQKPGLYSIQDVVKLKS